MMIFREPRAANRQSAGPPRDRSRSVPRAAGAHGLSSPGVVPRAYIRGAVFGLPLAAAALWMAAVTTTGAPARLDEPQATGEAAPPAPAPWFDLERQRARLEQIATAPDVVPSRNPFRFPAPPARTARSPLGQRASTDQPALSESPVPLADALVPVRLIGIAASPSSDGTRRSAILSGLGQVFIAGAGDLVAGHFRVAAVGEDAVELHDETTGQVVRLGLR